MKVLAVIPARAGSKRIQHKNRQELGGVELWERALRFAFTCTDLDRVVVSTDDETILERAASHGLHRPSHLARDCDPMNVVLQHAADCFGMQGDDFVVTLQPSNPFRKPWEVGFCLGAIGPANSAASCDESGKRDGNIYVTRVSMLGTRVFDAWTRLVRSQRSLDINTTDDLELARKWWAEIGREYD